MSQLRTVAWLTWRQLFARRRIIIAIAIAVVPLLFTLYYRLASEDRAGDRAEFVLEISRNVILGVLLPLAAVIFGTTAFGGEVDDGTLLYLLVKPVRRWQVVAVKYVVAVFVTAVVGAVAVLLPWLWLRNAELPFTLLRGLLFAVLVSALLYCALFTYLGLKTRHGLLVGLIYVIFFENVMSRNFDGVKSLSARELSVTAAQWASGGSIQWPVPGVGVSTVWWVGSVMLVVALAMTMRKLARYEVAERT